MSDELHLIQQHLKWILVWGKVAFFNWIWNFLPRIDAPWSRAAPVNDCTRCNNDSRDFAGLAGALVCLFVPLPKLNDKSGAFPDGWPMKILLLLHVKLSFICLLKFTRNSSWSWRRRNIWWSSSRWLRQWLLLKRSIAYKIWIIWVYIITFSQISWTESTKFKSMFIISSDLYEPKCKEESEERNSNLLH